jgi:signal transduction histidine kinase
MTLPYSWNVQKMSDEMKRKKQPPADLEKSLPPVARGGNLELLCRQAETPIPEVRNYADAIIETMRESLLVLDEHFAVLSANRGFYATFKTTPAETVGKSIYELGDGQWDIPELRVLLEAILPGNAKLDHYEVDHVFPVIGHKSMILNARRVFLGGIGMQMVLLAIEDITERRRAEDKVNTLNQELEKRIRELHDANEELKAFSYAVSHDLKAPLVTIGGFSRRLLERYEDTLDEKGRQYLTVINVSSTRMEQLIQDLLAFFSSGRKQARLSPLEMGKMTRAVFDRLKETCPKREIHLNAESMPDAEGDHAMITQVFVNLLSNAMKFTRPREMAVVETGGWREAERNVYYVKDNGIGFPPEHSEKLFRAFQRLRPVEEFEGTGLGLAIVKRIIERHGGQVWARGKPDEGATFYFSIPHAAATDTKR